MKRRYFLALLGAAATWPLAARSQQKTIPVIGFLGIATAAVYAPWLAAFRRGLADMGYIEGQNLSIEYRWAEDRVDQLPALAAELVGRNVDVIATTGGTAGVLAAKAATSTIPIVFSGGSDLVATGVVASLARPGGNITGISIMGAEMMPKRFELLSELLPEAKVVALLVNPSNPTTEPTTKDVQAAARAKGVQISILKARTEAEIEAAFDNLRDLKADALLVGADPLFNNRREQLVALASRHAIPAMYEWRESVDAGGLISYGPNFTNLVRQVGTYAGKILKGAKPADLPVQQPTKFELVINLKTAKALGLTIPPSILALADEVIE